MQTPNEWVFDVAAPGLVLVDGSGVIAFANARAEALFGYPRRGLPGQSMRQLLAEPGRSAFERCGQSLLQGGGEQTARMTHVHAVRTDGCEFETTLQLSVVSGVGGNFIAATLFAQALDSVLEHFSLALEAAPTGMILSNEHGTMVQVNAQTERLFGYERGELIGLPLEHLVPGRSRTTHERQRRAFLRDAQTRAMGAGQDLYGVRKDGCEVPVEIGLNALTLDARRFVLSSVVDITERKRTERTLRENEARYAELFDGTPIALFEQDYSETRSYLTALIASGVTNLETFLQETPDALAAAVSRVKTVRVNQQALKLFGAPDVEALQVLTADPSPDTLDWFRASLCQMLEGERRIMREARTRTLSGETRTLSTHLYVLPGHAESWSRVVVSVFDITSHERAEAQLRTSLRDKEVLLKEVHHRVKNNLQIVSSLLNMKADQFDDPAMRQVFADCRTRIQSLAFVHEQLYVSGTLSHVPFGHYVRTLVEHLRSSCGPPDRRIDSRVDIADIHLSIDDAIPCGLIVNELVTNSLKHAFAPRSVGTIEVQMRTIDNRRLELVVSDNGRGLPPERGSPRAESSGLELVYTFAEQLRAEVVIVRSPGTRFAFRFTPEHAHRANHIGD
jgi:PAS domain S-box-containing protein